jgi:hypothetical protein
MTSLHKKTFPLLKGSPHGGPLSMERHFIKIALRLVIVFGYLVFNYKAKTFAVDV